MAEELSDIIERQETGFRGFLQKAKKKRETKKVERRSERNRIQKIRTQEQKSLERRFIRAQERQKLEKRFRVKKKPTVREGFLFGPQPVKKKEKPAITLF